MGRVEKSVILNVPIEDCYRIWTDFEDYPRFMRYIQKITRRGKTDIYHWVRSAPGGGTVEWDVEVDLMEPPRLVSWRTLNNTYPAHAMVILLHDLGDNNTRVEAIMTYPGHTLGEFADDITSNPQRIIEENMKAFVDLAERRTPYHQPSRTRD